MKIILKFIFFLKSLLAHLSEHFVYYFENSFKKHFVVSTIVCIFTSESTSIMNTQTFQHRGTQMNKVSFSEMEVILEEKGMNVNECFSLMADENENVYVSDGFLRGLRTKENESGEWHHYFTKGSDGSFVAGKLNFD